MRTGSRSWERDDEEVRCWGGKQVFHMEMVSILSHGDGFVTLYNKKAHNECQPTTRLLVFALRTEDIATLRTLPFALDVGRH